MPDRPGRIHSLDALRGFAIFGILLINIQVFAGYGFIGTEGRENLSWSGQDDRIGAVLDVLVRAKFYSLFSLLFGYSFVMMARKAAGQAVRLHLRRMGGLLLIGILHSVLLWPWDILVLYALVGLLLAPCLHWRATGLALAGVFMLVLTALGTYFGPAIGLPDGRGDYAARVLVDSVPVFAGGTYMEVLQTNLRLTGSVFIEWLQGLRPLRVFGMFLLGASAATLALARPGSRHRAILWVAAIAGLAAGLALSIMGRNLDPETRWLWTLEGTFGPPLLAVGYAASLILWWNSAGSISAVTRTVLAPVGRMALTNYLLQSAICVPLFYGFGAGWFADVSLARLMLFSAGLFAAQVVFSGLWLSRFRQGPIEWLWRWQIKGRRPAMLKRHTKTAT